MTIASPTPENYSEKVFGGGALAYDPDNDLNCTTLLVDLDKGETLDIVFKNIEGEESGNYILKGIDKSENTFAAYDIGEIRRISISPFGALIASPENYNRDPHCSFTVKYKDGSSRKIYGDSSSAGTVYGSQGDRIEEHFGLKSGDVLTAFLSFDPEPIDVRNVIAVEINGTEIQIDAAEKSPLLPEPIWGENVIPEILTSNGGIYCTFLEETLTGDDAWAYVQELGETDIYYSLPYDKSAFVFTGYSFEIFGADCEVTALVGGTVEFAGYNTGFGSCVLILDENGHYWLYYHLKLNDIRVNEGDAVSAGDALGHTGTTGITTGQHYAMRVG